MNNQNKKKMLNILKENYLLLIHNKINMLIKDNNKYLLIKSKTIKTQCRNSHNKKPDINIHMNITTHKIYRNNITGIENTRKKTNTNNIIFQNIVRVTKDINKTTGLLNLIQIIKINTKINIITNNKNITILAIKASINRTLTKFNNLNKNPNK